LCLPDAARSGQYLAKHCRPATDDRLLQGISGGTVLETLRLPRDDPDPVRPRHRRPPAHMDVLGVTDRHTALISQDRGIRSDVRAGRRGAGRGQL